MQITNSTPMYAVEKNHSSNDGLPTGDNRFSAVFAQEKKQVVEKNKPQNNSQPIYLETNQGKNQIDPTERFSTTGRKGPVDLRKINVLLPTADNIDALAQHSSLRFKQMLSDYNIPEGPNQISYDSGGNTIIPMDYPYKNELEKALQDNEGLAEELRTVAALASHYVGMQQAASNAGSKYGPDSQISLKFTSEGGLSVMVDGEYYKSA